jgi:hypothetical protein
VPTRYTATFVYLLRPVAHWQATVDGMDCRTVDVKLAHVRSKVWHCLNRALEIAALEAALRQQPAIEPIERASFKILEQFELPPNVRAALQKVDDAHRQHREAVNAALLACQDELDSPFVEQDFATLTADPYLASEFLELEKRRADAEAEQQRRAEVAARRRPRRSTRPPPTPAELEARLAVLVRARDEYSAQLRAFDAGGRLSALVEW